MGRGEKINDLLTRSRKSDRPQRKGTAMDSTDLLHLHAQPDAADAHEVHLWGGLNPRVVPPADWQRFADNIAEILSAFGLDLDTEGTAQTPQRFLEALFDATAGYEGDPKLLTAFPTECRGGSDCRISQIIEGPISFYALCEHHALPFHGVAHIGYIAHENIIGISKLTRLVRLFARRFTVQERLGQQIADTLVGLMQPHGVAVRLEAEHLCTQMRGVREERSRTVTTVWRGAYETDAELRREFLTETRTHALGR
jgi:GTP cyclohydrolase IA